MEFQTMKVELSAIMHRFSNGNQSIWIFFLIQRVNTSDNNKRTINIIFLMLVDWERRSGVFSILDSFQLNQIHITSRSVYKHGMSRVKSSWQHRRTYDMPLHCIATRHICRLSNYNNNNHKPKKYKQTTCTTYDYSVYNFQFTWCCYENCPREREKWRKTGKLSSPATHLM